MIQIKKAVKSFDGFRALDGLDMAVPDGSVYGLVGPNGAGKSTVIRHITGIYRQDSGEIQIKGKPAFENTEARSVTAYIPDEIYYFTQASIKEMMNFYRGIYPRFDMERFNKLREVFSLDEKMPLRRMSRGMQKQAAFWLAISMRPELLVLDEPVDGLDPVMRRQIWSLVMSDVAENGTTVLISSHNLRELEDVCDRVGIINHGKMMLERDLDDLHGNIVKLQTALPEGGKLPEELEILHSGGEGRLRTLIVRGTAEKITNIMSAADPLFMDILPLSLEEIFIYELGGEDYVVKDIVL